MKKKDEIKKTKSAQELKADSMENVSGGVVEYNNLTGKYDILDDETRVIIDSTSSKRKANEINESYNSSSNYDCDDDDWY